VDSKLITNFLSEVKRFPKNPTKNYPDQKADICIFPVL